MSILNEAEQAVADHVLDRESEHRRHVVVALSGAHAYGFPSPDSDLDLKAIHIAPTEALLGLDGVSNADTPADKLEVISGVESDYTSNELGGALRGILRGNGNYIERVLGALILRSSELHAELAEICRGAFCRRVHHHYRGFAKSQLDRVRDDEAPPAKRVLYVLRTALTGTHLLRSGELVVDVTELLDRYGHGDARELIAAKKAGELVRLDERERDVWLRRLARAMTELDDAHASSRLPADAPNHAAANAWLVRARIHALR